MRLSKRFIRNLENMACDAALTVAERALVSGMLVRLYTQTPQNAPRVVRGNQKSKVDTSSLSSLIEELNAE